MFRQVGNTRSQQRSLKQKHEFF